MNSNLFKILLVEDNEGDVKLTQVSLESVKEPVRMDVVSDGEQAIFYLKQERNYKNSDRPDLILLDLNLPKKDGREVLEEIKKDSKLKSIPVAILTSCQEDGEILSSYNLGADFYITKPISLDQFNQLIKAIKGLGFSNTSKPQNK